MTDTADHIEERPAKQKRDDTLWVTDAELIRRLGVPEKIARPALAMLDRDIRKGFPQKQALWGNRRHWPSVKAYFDSVYGGKLLAPERRSGHG